MERIMSCIFVDKHSVLAPSFLVYARIYVCVCIYIYPLHHLFFFFVAS